MAKILVFNSSMAELAALQEIFSKEPFFEFFSVESESQIKFYRESLGEGASPILLCCGLEGNNSNWSQTRVLFEDIKIAWPKAKVFLVSFDSLLMDQTEHKLPAKVDEKIDLSDDSEKNRSEIIKKIKAGLPAKKKSENEGIIPGLLIVDDEENILKTIPMLLRSVGFDRIWTAGTI